MTDTVTAIGLVFDIVGVVILFFYGLPSRVAREVLSPLQRDSDGNLIADGAPSEAQDRATSIGPGLGIGTLVLGFVLQIVALCV